MKVIIQIPCYNEEKSLPITVSGLPKKIDGIDRVEVLVIDDGSTDETVKAAESAGVNHIVSLSQNTGLANTFAVGIENCLKQKADILVNTDGDNQYCGDDVPKLIEPILAGKADVVIGERPIEEIPHFPWMKKKILKLGGWIVRRFTRIDVKDVVSGFRAYSKEAARKMNILTDYSYTLENLIQLRHQGLRIVSVPIRTNEKLRESRLIKSVPKYVTSQIATLLRVYTTYKALRVFAILGLLVMIPGLIGFTRFLYFFYIMGEGQGHIQSLIFSVVFLNVGFLILVFGILADLVGSNRKLMEKALYELKKDE
jgi:glycosyltransferase involved in cell wall biosynthesis